MSSQDNYGWRDPNYAAQTMFASHRGGIDYGDLGSPSLGYVTDINSAEDQTFDPMAAEQNGMLGDSYGMPHEDFGGVHPSEVHHPMPEPHVTAMPNEGSRSNAEPIYANPVSEPIFANPAPVRIRSNGMSADTVGAIAGGVLGLAGVGLSYFVQKGQAKQDAEAAAANAEFAAAEAERLEQERLLAEANRPPFTLLIVGGVAIAGLIGGAIYLTRSGDEKKKKSTVKAV